MYMVLLRRDSDGTWQRADSGYVRAGEDTYFADTKADLRRHGYRGPFEVVEGPVGKLNPTTTGAVAPQRKGETMTTHYTADQCHTGGYECDHKHRTREAAERCLPKLNRSPSGSLTKVFSMARIHKYVDGEPAVDADPFADNEPEEWEYDI